MLENITAIPYETRMRVHRRDHYTCRYCGKVPENPQCDHVISRHYGGSNEMDNLVTACRSCNIMKGDMTPEEFAEYLIIREKRYVSRGRMRGQQNMICVRLDENGEFDYLLIHLQIRFSFSATIAFLPADGGHKFKYIHDVSTLFLFHNGTSVEDLKAGLEEAIALSQSALYRKKFGELRIPTAADFTALGN